MPTNSPISSQHLPLCQCTVTCGVLKVTFGPLSPFPCASIWNLPVGKCKQRSHPILFCHYLIWVRVNQSHGSYSNILKLYVLIFFFFLLQKASKKGSNNLDITKTLSRKRSPILSQELLFLLPLQLLSRDLTGVLLMQGLLFPKCCPCLF